MAVKMVHAGVVCACVQTFNMQRVSMCCMDDDVVCNVGVQRDLVVLRRRVDIYSAGIVSEVIVGYREEFCVLHVKINDANGRVV